MPTKQLVGQTCVLCAGRIGSALDARFCPACRCPVHTACTADRPAPDGGCPSCHAPAAVAGQSRRAAEEEAAVAVRAGRGQPAGCILMVGIIMVGLGLLNVVRKIDATGPGAAGDIGNGLVGVVIGLAILAFGLMRLSRPGK